MKKMNRMIGLTRRTFHYMDENKYFGCCRRLDTSLMRPHMCMDYADCTWSPHLKVDNIAQFENGQRRATILDRDLRGMYYEPV